MVAVAHTVIPGRESPEQGKWGLLASVMFQQITLKLTLMILGVPPTHHLGRVLPPYI